jgi:hypothetical protein
VTELSSVLKRIRASRPRERPRPGERCDVCAALIPEDHDHVVDLDNRALLCACRACWLVFSPQGSGGRRFRAVPDRYLSCPGASLSGRWDQLDIPVGVAFFFLNSRTEQFTAFYPSPAGATESLLSLDAWNGIVEANPQLATLQPDVEAVLIRTEEALRTDGTGPECFIVPIDVCYELVGEMRRVWRGFDGGTEAHAVLRALFDRIRARAVDVAVAP